MEQPATEHLILVVEEDPEQVLLIQAALQDSAISCQAIANVIEALDFLHRRGKYVNAERPSLILLNLVDSAGWDVLAQLKSSPQLRRIPVVILTDSDDTEDIFRSYALQGNSYVIKASDRDQLYQIIRRIQEFWLGIVTLPIE